MEIRIKMQDESRTAPDREVDDEVFSAAAAVVVGALSLSSAVADVVLRGVAGVVDFVVAVVLANDETACLGVVVVLVGVGLCAVDTAGLAVDLDGAEGTLEGPTLAGLGGATVAAGGKLVTGVGRDVVDTALAVTGLS